MKLEYRNGVRISKLVHEMTPLEAAIERYEEKAKKYLSQKNKKTPLTKEERKEELDKALAHLKHERRHLRSFALLDRELKEYRKLGMVALNGNEKQREEALTLMKSEKHHPTDDLEKMMRAEGVPKPTPRHTAHHIVPGKGQYNQAMLDDARIHLHLHGIRINDPANGVYLLNKNDYTPHWTMSKSKGHLTYHTAAYERWVSQRVMNISHIDFLKTELQVIGRLLQHNEPKVAIDLIKKRAQRSI